MKKQLAIIGLGKMGKNLAENLKNKDWDVKIYNRTTSVAEEMAQDGFDYAENIPDLIAKLESPKVVWLMLPAGEVTENAIFGEQGLAKLLKPGDYLIDGANSYFKDSKSRYQKLENTGINYCDVGVSGGPSGALNGACLMIGGIETTFSYLEPLFKDIALDGKAYDFFKGYGAGHFVKMVHNGIEYGMMQAIAEGFEVLQTSDYEIDLEKATHIYNNGSVITSRLTEWLANAFKNYGTDLMSISGEVAQSGEGEWTVKTAAELGVPTPIISGSVDFRKQSQGKPSFTGKVLTALRNQFGGHATTK